MEVRRKKRTRRYRECRSYYRVSNRRSDRRSQDVHPDCARERSVQGDAGVPGLRETEQCEGRVHRSADGRLPGEENLLFASNEPPDALFRSGLSPLEAVRYGSAGQLIPLEGLIDEYAPNLKN